MIFEVFTLFPAMFSALDESIIGRAMEKGSIKINPIDIRNFSSDKHGKVDDQPFGGGAGMVLEVEPVFKAVESTLGMKSGDIEKEEVPVILLTPQGRKFDSSVAMELSKKKRIALICGHYEGVDDRVREHLASDEISIGDYVLSGGEIAAMVLIDAISRNVPGVVGKEESVISDSFYGGLLKYPQYTRPRNFRGWEVPDVLLSGNHAKIEEWRRKKAVERTALVRPDLLGEAALNDEEREFAEEFVGNARCGIDEDL